MNQEPSNMKNDKTLPKHNYITKELIRRKFIPQDNDFDLYLYDFIFEDLLKFYEFKTILVATSYTISCIKRNNFKDEEGKDIICLFSYFKKALESNLKRLTTPVYLSWEDY